MAPPGRGRRVPGDAGVDALGDVAVVRAARAYLVVARAVENQFGTSAQPVQPPVTLPLASSDRPTR